MHTVFFTRENLLIRTRALALNLLVPLKKSDKETIVED